jgi:hypothetical protein
VRRLFNLRARVRKFTLCGISTTVVPIAVWCHHQLPFILLRSWGYGMWNQRDRPVVDIRIRNGHGWTGASLFSRWHTNSKWPCDFVTQSLSPSHETKRCGTFMWQMNNEGWYTLTGPSAVTPVIANKAARERMLIESFILRSTSRTFTSKKIESILTRRSRLALAYCTPS